MLVARHRMGGPVSAVRGRTARTPHPLVASLALQLAEFARAVRGKPVADLATANEAAAVMRAIGAARASAVDRGRTVAVTTRLDA